MIAGAKVMTNAEAAVRDRVSHWGTKEPKPETKGVAFTREQATALLAATGTELQRILTKAKKTDTIPPEALELAAAVKKLNSLVQDF